MEKIYGYCNLRNYSINTKQSEFYKRMYKNQTLDFVLKMKEKYRRGPNLLKSIIIVNIGFILMV